MYASPMTTKVRVSDADVAELQAELMPGQAVPFTKLYERYASMARVRGEVPASPLGLSRALTRGQWQTKRLRKARGRRGHQKVTEVTARVVPGALAFSPEDLQMCTALRELLDGRDHAYIYNEYIWDAYQVVNRRHGRNSMGRNHVAAWLTDKGFPKQMSGGKVGRSGWSGIPSRYVDRARVDRIVPPVINGQQTDGT